MIICYLPKQVKRASVFHPKAFNEQRAELSCASTQQHPPDNIFFHKQAYHDLKIKTAVIKVS
jgi:hypothetical protein